MDYQYPQRLTRSTLLIPLSVLLLLILVAGLSTLQLWGNLGQFQQNPEDFTAYARQTTGWTSICLLSLGTLLSVVMSREIFRLFNALRHSRDYAIYLQEEERRRIAQDLHDSVVQELIALKRHYDVAKLDTLAETVRRICTNLKPALIEDVGLLLALDSLFDGLRRNQVQVVFETDCPEPLVLPDTVQLALFRMVQELVNNVSQHAQASRVEALLLYHPQESPLLRFYLKDNGVGLHQSQASQSVAKTRMGLPGLKERAESLGGTVAFISPLPQAQGTRVELSLPVLLPRKPFWKPFWPPSWGASAPSSPSESGVR